MLFALSLLRNVFFVRGADEVEVARAARVESIVHRHVDSVWRTARDLGVPSRDLEDILQEVLLVVVRRLGDIDLVRERAFVVATTTRVVANWRRTRRRRPEELTESMDAIDIELVVGRVAHTPEQALEHGQKLTLLRHALGEMPEPQRVAFVLFELEQLTAREIAEQLGVAESAVFSRVRRAWQVFRRCVERHAIGNETAERDVQGVRHG
jgi:RNA polymerase sigma-70 factor (ECF subfamily)